MAQNDASPGAVLEGMWDMLREKHEAEIHRIVAAQMCGLPTRIWFDEGADTFRFEVID